MIINLKDIKENEVVQTYIQKADESLTALGFTEHSMMDVMIAPTTQQIISFMVSTSPAG